MTSSRPKNHHYVSQFLLQGFAHGSNARIHVFDKQEERTFVSSTRNVASEVGFYDFAVEGERQTIEPFLANMEASVAPIVRRIRQHENLKLLTD